MSRQYRPTGRLRIGGETRAGLIARNRQAARGRRRQSRMRQPGYALQVEKKGMDTNIGTAVQTVTNATGDNEDMVVCNLIRTGTGSFNRIGRKVRLQSIKIQGTATCMTNHILATGDLLSNTLRQVIVWDKQPSGVLPVFSTIFGTTNQAGAESTDYLDPLKYDNMDRFQIIRDKRIIHNPMVHNDQGASEDRTYSDYSLDEFIKLGGRETVYSGQSTPMTIADISTGALYIIYRSETDSEASTRWNVNPNCKVRLRYSD